MAVETLYTAVKADFIKKLRLSNTNQEDTLAVIDTAISTVRIGIIQRLSIDRTIEVQGFAISENPTTDDEILRSTVALAEVNWVTAELIRLLPQMFLEGQATAKQNWNNEALTRDAGDLMHFRNSLMVTVNEMLALVEEPVNDSAGPVKVEGIGRKVPYGIFANSPGIRHPL